MSFKRVNRGKGHSYHDEDGAKLDGVTNLINEGLPKPALINWAANTTADFAIDNWDELSREPISERVKKLRRARFVQRDAAARRGTEVHQLAESLIHGELVEVPDAIAGHVEAYVKFLDEWQVSPVLVETSVASRRWNYAGTLDVVGDLVGTSCAHCEGWPVVSTLHLPRRGCRYLYDIKTAQSGIFPEAALQMSAYRYADVFLDADGNEQSMSELGICGALAVWVRSEGYDVYRVEADELAHNKFLHVATVARWACNNDQVISEALPPPNS